MTTAFPFLPSLLSLEGFQTQLCLPGIQGQLLWTTNLTKAQVWRGDLDTSTKPTLAENHFPAGANPISMFSHSSWLMDTFPQKGCVGLCSVFRKIFILSVGRRRLYRNITEFCAQPPSLPSFHVPKECKDQGGKQSDGVVWCVRGKLPKACPSCSFIYL